MYRKPSCMNPRELNVPKSFVIESKKSSSVASGSVGRREVVVAGIAEAAERDQFEPADETYDLAGRFVDNILSLH